MVDERQVTQQPSASTRARIRRTPKIRRAVRALLVTLVALFVAGIALWQWPTGFYEVSTFIGRIVCGVRLDSVTVNGKQVAVLTNEFTVREPAHDSQPTPILFLHGYGTNKEAMMAEMRWFSGSRKVIAPDLPGFGDNPLAPNDLSLTGEQYVQWIEEFRIAARLPEVDVIGESMGGALAAAYAATYPRAVRRIVLQSPAGLTPPRMNAVMRSLDQGENPLDVRSEAGFDEALRLCFVHPPPVPSPNPRLSRAKVSCACCSPPRHAARARSISRRRRCSVARID